MKNNKKVILVKAGDWYMWIATVRIRASNLGIWNIINPDLKEKPQRLKKPDCSGMNDIHSVRASKNAEETKNAMEMYNLDKEVYKIDLAEYEHQVKALTDLITFLQDTITAHNVTYLINIELHSWNLL